ncbi:peptidase S8 [bacterium]|nr:peptidase S8 [bacterium]
MKKLSLVAGSLAMALLAGCSTGPMIGGIGGGDSSTDFRADGTSKTEIVVRFNTASVKGLPYKVKKTIKGINASVIEVPSGKTPEQVIADIKAKYSVKYAHNVNRVMMDVYDDPMIKDQYSLNITNALQAWDTQKGDMNTMIAVIDSGVDMTHPDLKDKIVKAYNVFSKDANVKDMNGHGTHCAGIAAAALNGVGTAGVAPNCGIMAVQVLNSQGGGSDQTIADGIVWAADNGAKVMTMSLGLYKRSKVVEDALQYALDKDVVLCASAGNNNAMNDPETAPHLPSTYPGVIEVAATDAKDQKASFSNWGKTVVVAAPGHQILSTVPTYANGTGKTSYSTMSGTSMASPFAAGVAGLIRSQHPEWNREQVRQAMEKAVADLGQPGFDQYFGHGRVDALKAVSL